MNEMVKARRCEIKSHIEELKKSNEELFKMWCYDRALDEKVLKNGARNNLLKIEELEQEYNKLK